MTRNVGTRDRVFRTLGALGLLTCALIAPLPWLTRALAFGVPALYMLSTALSGVCFGYKMMGRSTCAVSDGSP